MNDPGLFSVLVTQTWQIAAVAMVVWLLVRTTARNRPHLAHALWLLVLIKVLTPPVWSSPSSPFSWISIGSSQRVEPELVRPALDELGETGLANLISPLESSKLFSAVPVEIGFESEQALATVPASTPLPATIPAPKPSPGKMPVGWTTITSWIWIVGALIGIAVLVVRYLLFILWIRRTAEMDSAELSDLTRQLCRKLGLRTKVRVRILESPVGPVVLGLLRPTVILPAVIVRGKPAAELAPLLAHELIHFRRGDLWWALVQCLARNLFWFHPLVHWAARRVTREAEQCCDEETIANLGCSPAAYARSLLGVLEQKHQLRVAPALPGVRPVDITSARLERIMKPGNGIHRKSPAWTWLVLLLGCAIVLPGARWIGAQETADSLNSVEAKKADTLVNEYPVFEFQVTIAHLAEPEVEQLGIDWKFENQPTNESSETAPVKQASDSTSTDLEIPTGIAHLDLDQLQVATDALNAISRKFDHRRFDTNKVMARVGLTGSILVGGEVMATASDESRQWRTFGTQVKLTPTQIDSESASFDFELKISKFDKEPLAIQQPEGIDRFASMSHTRITAPLVSKSGETVVIRSKCDCGDGELYPIIVLITPRERSRTGVDAPKHRAANPVDSEPLVLKSRVTTRPRQTIYTDSKSNHYQFRDWVTICSAPEDITVSVGQKQRYKFAFDIPESSIEKPDLAKLKFVSECDAEITGLKPGKTACTIKLPDGSTNTFDITVTENPLPDDREESNAPIPVIARIGGQCSIIAQHEITDYTVADKDLIKVEKVNDQYLLLKASTPGNTTVVVTQKNGQSLHLHVSITGKPIMYPGVWISSKDDDRNDPSSHKKISMFGKEVNVSQSVTVEEKDGTVDVTGLHMLWTNDDDVLVSAGQAKVSISGSMQSQQFRLKGNAKFCSGPDIVMEADEINYDISYGDQQGELDQVEVDLEMKSNARMSSPKNARSGAPAIDASADRITFDGTNFRLIGNAKVTQTMPDGKETSFEGREIQMTEAGDVEIIEQKTEDMKR